MNKLLLIATLVASVSFGEQTAAPAKHKARRHRTPEELEERARTMMDRHYGGTIRKAGSASGKVVFVNAQKLVPTDRLVSALNEIDENVHPMWELKDATGVNLTNPKDDIARLGGAVGVVLAESPSLPALLLAPEEGWAVVNVTALNGKDVSAEKLASRTRRELLRAFALAGGCAFMSRGQIVLRGDVRHPADLDSLLDETYGVDALVALGRTLPQRGVIPWKQTTYKKACQEGWAPAPTNEYQKAIWEKVHAMPSEPIKIKPETKKVTE